MAQKPILVATSVVYYSEHDEAAFFQWLDRLKCVEGYRGEVRDLFITLTRQPFKYELQELLALFFRYEVGMAQLAQFETRSNREWFRDPEKYWHHRVFGDAES